MIVHEIVLTCSNPNVARAAVESIGGDFAQDLGHLIGDPAEGEKRGMDPALRKQFKDPVDILLDSTRQVVPCRARDIGHECRDLKIILDVDGEGEVAEAVVWLCSDRASLVTGTAFAIDLG